MDWRTRPRGGRRQGLPTWMVRRALPHAVCPEFRRHHGGAQPTLQRGGEIPQQLDVQHDDCDRDRRGEQRHPARRNESSHLALVGGEHDQRYDGKGKLQRQDHLRQNEKLRRALGAIPNRPHRNRHYADGEGEPPPARVNSRLSQGGRRMSRKPSITICPDSVAVTVEFKPQQSSAMANRVGAKAEPRSGAKNECTWSSSATFVWPVRWKVAAARIRIEALIRSANISAMVESMVASVIASRFSGSVRPKARVCTMPECR